MNFTQEKTSLLRLPTPLERMRFDCGNELYVKRDDLTDFALGGNKARKMEFFLKDILDNDCDTIVTYGSFQSNHCRIVSAAAARYGMRCVLILEGADSNENLSGNALFYSLARAEVVHTVVSQVAATIEQTLESLRKDGRKPYFIPGGGHSFLGTRAYVAAYDELLQQAAELGIEFDFLFHASGTGTTQTGLVIGNIERKQNTKIVGISIARRKERGINVLKESIKEYDKHFQCQTRVPFDELVFEDAYIGSGYGDFGSDVVQTIHDVYRSNAIVFDPVYTGKAFHGMTRFLRTHRIRGKKILFWHTGGLPCFFDHGAVKESTNKTILLG